MLFEPRFGRAARPHLGPYNTGWLMFIPGTYMGPAYETAGVGYLADVIGDAVYKGKPGVYHEEA